MSRGFITRLARDSVNAKWELRELFAKSPVWCEDIDALVINGTRTHNPDYRRIRQLARDILFVPRVEAQSTGQSERALDIDLIVDFFSNPSIDNPEPFIAAIKRVAPRAYAPGKKLSRVFKAICTALGVADETAGSEFQHQYAQLADELNSKKINFKLYVSINPAHFITMSNPKCDHRGDTLTSCHSFNSNDYEYNNGCTGYARDEYTFIVFTVDDPTNPETLNNRKTTRQIFAYKPGNGLLLQSRMYNTSGGVYGAAEDSKLYRDLIQREISMLEGQPNLWRTSLYYGHPEFERALPAGEGFGGYPDWVYKDFDAHVSVRADHEDDWDGFSIGTYGICVSCAEENSHGVYCEDCEPGRNYCEHCEEYTSGELYTVHDHRGNEIQVCEDCRDNYYRQCEHCGEWYPDDDMYETVDGDYICEDCRDDYICCEECGEYVDSDDAVMVHDRHGYEVYVCPECCDRHYVKCDDCDEYYPDGSLSSVTRADGSKVEVCDDCAENYVECPHCGELIEMCVDGTCPSCGAVVEEHDDGKETDVA